jgi:hypothetical protein
MDKTTLDYPIKTGAGQTISELTLRRPKVSDMKKAQRGSTDPASQELALIASLTEEKLTPEDMEELDLADYAKLQALFRGYVGQ